MKNKKRSNLDFTLKFILFCLIFALVSAFVTLLSVKLLGKEKNAETAYTSTPENTPTVIIDAGHGGEDGGAVGVNGCFEKDINLNISKTLSEMLKCFRINVIMTRTEDILLYDRNADYMGHKKSLDLKARLNVAKEHPDAIFVSIHMNTFPQEKYNGLQVYYTKNNPQSKLLAKEIRDSVRTHLQPENKRETKAADSSIYLLNRAPSTAVLVECGFLSNTEECNKLSSEEYQKQLAFTLLLSIINYFNTESKIL